ncbi:aspartate kinase [Halarsenatibacter silvermanii]|uniref:Aspartokinase n=1 Tax=Halarsenatibacter silvermanii TaxID=321763 RepID=A0A1G9MEM6_9FIRM|nr:aspartate kinase [Halarsenatibacter silvermanii]SDL72738.1 aspartate kinase [Halarsenatibacter silvermanii]
MSTLVQKYGGSSLANRKKIEKVADRVQKAWDEWERVVVIVSAMGDTTDELINLAHEIADDPDPREMDMLLNTGEQISISLLTMALQKRDIPAVSLTGSQLGVATTDRHQKARIKDIDQDRVQEELDRGRVVVAAGFQGVTEDNEYTTLGRGGSDTTAVALAAKLEARCEIYTDVAGIHTCDPGLVERARCLEKISYEEMMEMASLGAEVIHPRAVELACKYEVPLYVGDAFSQDEGTDIGEETEYLEESVITGMAVNLDDIQINLRGVKKRKDMLSKIFETFGEAGINIDMISQLMNGENKMQLSFTAPAEDFQETEKILKSREQSWNVKNWWINEDICKMSVIGPGMRSQPGVAASVFNLMQQYDIMVRMVTTSEIKISWLIPTADHEKAAELVAREFDLAD